VSGGIGALILSSILLLALGSLIVRVAWRGEHLGRFRLVSYVRVHEGVPRRHHRVVTAAIGGMSLLIGLTFALLALYLFGIERGIFRLPS
jgi:UDP-N-acetylmuramyl pentapeptide phosphotransferase/UDP-N-acetylglucosamine-1-phosphate transferase